MFIDLYNSYFLMLPLTTYYFSQRNKLKTLFESIIIIHHQFTHLTIIQLTGDIVKTFYFVYSVVVVLRELESRNVRSLFR